MITELRDFYLVDNKIFCAEREFFGYDPEIGPVLTFVDVGFAGTVSNEVDFELKNYKFKAKLTHTINRGPLGGNNVIEIFRNNQLLFTLNYGSKGYGHTYGSNTAYHTEGSDRFILTKGGSLLSSGRNPKNPEFKEDSYYLLWFSNTIIPEKFILKYPDIDFDPGKTYSKEEVEKFRQVEYRGTLKTEKLQISFTQSTVYGFTRKDLWNVYPGPRRPENAGPDDADDVKTESVYKASRGLMNRTLSKEEITVKYLVRDLFSHLYEKTTNI